jgi:hypothetical protein
MAFGAGVTRGAQLLTLSLGRATDVSLEQARERANELTSAARGGRDLVGEEGEARDAAASRITVEKLIDLYLRRLVVGRLCTAKAIERGLRRDLAPIVQRAPMSHGVTFVSSWTPSPTGAACAKRKSAGRWSAPCSAGLWLRISLRPTPPTDLSPMIPACRAIGS